MTTGTLFLLVGVGLAVLGAGRMLLSGDLLRQVVALNVAGSGVLMVLLAVAHESSPDRPDPVLHALVLTGIVITVSVTALALALLRRVEAAEGHADEHADEPGDVR